MRQSIWSPFEVALLIDAYWRIRKNCIARKDAVSEISALLRNYAIVQGQDIDETYRNENGISLRLEELHYLFSDGKAGVKKTSNLFRIMVQMYQQNPQAYMDILNRAKEMLDDSLVQSNSENDYANSSTSEDISDGIRLILNQHFPYGFKLDSVRDLMRFRRFADDDAIKNIPVDDEELKSKIKSVGTIINDKLYVKSDDLSEELRNIVQNIFSDGTAVIYYEALLEHEAEWMSTQHISSEAMLKELLQKYFPDCYHARRFMVNGKKQTEKESLTAELKRVWGNTTSRSVADLSTELPYIPTDYIWRGISGSFFFSRVREGVYFLNDRLIMTKEESDAILDYVNNACDKYGFASLSDLPLESIEEVNYEIPLSTIQMAVYGRLLSNQYTLNGKILTKDNSELNSIVLLKQFLSAKECCTYSELAEKNLELTGVPNRKNVFQALYDSMVRIDVNQFVTPSAVAFQIDEIDQVLSELITDHFCAVRDITTFALFPMCGQSWNHYLLESYCYRYSKRYSLSLINFNDKNAGIITEKEFGRSYSEMLAIAAARAEIELTPEAIGQYLFHNGFAAKSKFTQLSDVTAMAQTLRKES